MQSPPRSFPPSLFVFAIVYGGMTVLAGVLGNKQAALFGGLAVEAGIFAFLLLVVLSSATAQLHGKRAADRMVLWGFVPLALSSALIFLVLALPASAEMDPERLSAFDIILGTTPRIMLAGPVAYGVSMFLNVWLFDRLRFGGEGLGVMVRGAIASAISQAIDTVIFITLAFYGLFPILPLIVGQGLAKIVLSLIVVPFAIAGAVALGRWLDQPRPR